MRGRPSQARSRFRQLGFGRTISRPDILAVCGTARAGDQFVHRWTRRGGLVPVAWGCYRTVTHGVLQQISAMADEGWARMVGWSSVLPDLLGKLGVVTFLGPVIRSTTLSLADPGLLLGLRPGQRSLPRVPPQTNAMIADLAWPIQSVGVPGAPGPVTDVPVPHPADAAWILLQNRDARVRQAASELMQRLSPGALRRVYETARLAAAPSQLIPSLAGTRIPIGPPQLYRIYAPAWYAAVHESAMQVRPEAEVLA